MRNVPLAPLSVVILTHNEEANLPNCLASLGRLNHELFVVDSGSSDRTVEIARAAGATVAEHPFQNYSAQRNWALQNLSLRTDWVLHLDADERLTPELADEISVAIARARPEVAGFLLRRRTVFMGRWIRHGDHYPSYQLRLFRRGRGFCEDRLYDQHFLVDGPVERLKQDYVDIVASDVATWTRRHTRWAELEAAELAGGRAGGGRQVRARAAGNPIERRRWLRAGLYGRAPLFLRVFLYWLYRYIIRGGFRDGKEGLIFHFLQGCWFRFLVDATIYEALHSSRSQP